MIKKDILENNGGGRSSVENLNVPWFQTSNVEKLAGVFCVWFHPGNLKSHKRNLNN